jgi:hypothetical protein
VLADHREPNLNNALQSAQEQPTVQFRSSRGIQEGLKRGGSPFPFCQPSWLSGHSNIGGKMFDKVKAYRLRDDDAKKIFKKSTFYIPQRIAALSLW